MRFLDLLCLCFGRFCVLSSRGPFVVRAEHPDRDELTSDASDRVVEGIEPVSTEIIAMQIRMSTHTKGA